MKRKQEIESVRWDLALRYRLIETVVWWEGRLTTGHLMQSFGISRQQASKDINSYITDYAPKNLEYDKHLKGYVPSRHFKPLFIDDSASAYPRRGTARAVSPETTLQMSHLEPRKPGGTKSGTKFERDRKPSGIKKSSHR